MAADPSEQSSRVALDHLDDGANSAALLADPARERALELDLGRSVRPIAELVLEPLNPEHVALAVRQHPGEQEAGQPIRGLGQHEKRIAHRRRAEPLVPGQRVPAGLAGNGLGPCGVGPHVRAALLLRHAHAGDDPSLQVGALQAGLVCGRREQRLPDRGDVRVNPKRGDRSVRHHDRAQVTALDLTPDQQSRGPSELGQAGGVRGPRRPGQAVAHRGVHQAVPRRVELDLVDAPAVPVVRAQDRRVLVGQPPPVEGLGRPGDLPKSVQRALVDEALAVLSDCVPQRPVGRIQVEAVQGWRLVRHVVGRRHAQILPGRK